MRAHRDPAAPTLTALVTTLLAALLAACAPGAAGDAGDAEGATDRLAPTFPAVTGDAVPAAPGSSEVGATSAPSVPVADPGPAPAPAGPAPTVPTGPATPAPPEGTIPDPTGDVAAGAVTHPVWADLVGARLTRTPELFELRITLGGGDAPTSSGGSDRTFNVASFYDVDGDGIVDYEVWVNLADGGWSGSWFDDRAGTAAFDDDARVGITVQGADLLLRFPLDHVGGAESFRWSLASEYGTYPALGTEGAARDEAPDAGAPAAFPG